MVDKALVTPLYQQIANEIIRDVLADVYGEGDNIGSHRSIANRFGVSIITVRKAIQTLESRGIVDVRQGKGTFVRRRAFIDPLENLTGISAILSNEEIDSEVKVPVMELVTTPRSLDSDVVAGMGENALFIRRLVLVRGVPIANADMFIPGRYADAFSKAEVERRMVYRIFRDDLGVQLGYGRQIIRAGGASGEVAKTLRLAPGTPVLELVRRSYDDGGALIEYMILTYDAKKYWFEVEMELSRELGRR